MVLTRLLTGLLLTALLIGCAKSNAPRATTSAGGIQSVNLNDPLAPAAGDGPIEIAAAKNEWVSFVVQVTAAKQGKLRIRPPRTESGDTFTADCFAAEQILPMPVDV